MSEPQASPEHLDGPPLRLEDAARALGVPRWTLQKHLQQFERRERALPRGVAEAAKEGGQWRVRLAPGAAKQAAGVDLEGALVAQARALAAESRARQDLEVIAADAKARAEERALTIRILLEDRGQAHLLAPSSAATG